MAQSRAASNDERADVARAFGLSKDVVEYSEDQAKRFAARAESLPPPPDTAGGKVGRVLAVVGPPLSGVGGRKLVEAVKRSAPVVKDAFTRPGLMVMTAGAGGPPSGGTPKVGKGGGAAAPAGSKAPTKWTRETPRDYATPNTKSYSGTYASERDARALARTKLGRDPIEVEPGKLRSRDGRWQYRGKPDDLHGHGPTDSSHVHIERLDPKTGEVLENWHLRWKQ